MVRAVAFLSLVLVAAIAAAAGISALVAVTDGDPFTGRRSCPPCALAFRAYAVPTRPGASAAALAAETAP